MSSASPKHPLWERLVDAREAAHCLNVPMYLLSHPEERARWGVPHYRVGKLVRFKLDELMHWIESYQRRGRSAAKGGRNA